MIIASLRAGRLDVVLLSRLCAPSSPFAYILREGNDYEVAVWRLHLIVSLIRD